MTAAAQVDVACGVAQAWALVSRVERIGEFSPECVHAAWLPDHPRDSVGARFEGRNRVVHDGGAAEWVRPCEVLEWDPPRRFAWAVGDRFDGTPASWWAFDLAVISGRVRITQCFRHYPDGLSGVRGVAEEDPENAPDFVAARIEGLRDGMAQTLQRMKLVLESEGQASSWLQE
jgi:uncharacterized protein YndB with AHSA1/START domain